MPIHDLVQCNCCGRLRDQDLAQKCFACGQADFTRVPLGHYELRQLIIQQQQKLAALYQRMTELHNQDDS